MTTLGLKRANQTSFKKGQKVLPNGKPMGWKGEDFVPWNKGKKQWPNGLPESIKAKCGLASKGRKNYWLWNKQTRNCDWCGKTFSDIASKIKKGRKFCCRICALNATAAAKRPRKDSYSYYHRISTRTVKLDSGLKQCSKCSTDKDLLVHHKDGNHANNLLQNLEVLCKSCHSRLHRLEKVKPLNF